MSAEVIKHQAPEDARELLVGTAQEYVDVHRDVGEPIKMSMLTTVWIEGLKEAGHAAKLGRRWNGKYAAPLPFVIDLPCPFGHRTEDRADYATLRLLLENNAWLSIFPDGSCPSCSDGAVERWLLTCPQCERGEDSDEHAAFDGCCWEGYGTGCRSPFECVVHALEDVAWLMRARLVLRSPEEYEEWQVRAAQRRLAADAAEHPEPPKTAEAAAQWLADVTDDDGNPLVPSSLGLKAAWERVREIDGRPTQALVREGQTLRRAEPDDGEHGDEDGDGDRS